MPYTAGMNFAASPTSPTRRLAEQALKALPKPKFQGPAHPFADDDMWR